MEAFPIYEDSIPLVDQQDPYIQYDTDYIPDQPSYVKYGEPEGDINIHDIYEEEEDELPEAWIPYPSYSNLPPGNGNQQVIIGAPFPQASQLKEHYCDLYPEECAKGTFERNDTIIRNETIEEDVAKGTGLNHVDLSGCGLALILLFLLLLGLNGGLGGGKDEDKGRTREGGKPDPRKGGKNGGNGERETPEERAKRKAREQAEKDNKKSNRGSGKGETPEEREARKAEERRNKRNDTDKKGKRDRNEETPEERQRRKDREQRQKERDAKDRRTNNPERAERRRKAAEKAAKNGGKTETPEERAEREKKAAKEAERQKRKNETPEQTAERHKREKAEKDTKKESENSSWLNPSLLLGCLLLFALIGLSGAGKGISLPQSVPSWNDFRSPLPSFNDWSPPTFFTSPRNPIGGRILGSKTSPPIIRSSPKIIPSKSQSKWLVNEPITHGQNGGPQIKINHVNSQGDRNPILVEEEIVIDSPPIIVEEKIWEPLSFKFTGPTNPNRLLNMLLTILIVSLPLFIDFIKDYPEHSYVQPEYVASIIQLLILASLILIGLLIADYHFKWTTTIGPYAEVSIDGVQSGLTPVLVGAVETTEQLVWGLEDVLFGDSRVILGMGLAALGIFFLSQREPSLDIPETDFANATTQALVFLGALLLGMFFWNA
uniref:Uncharacterized protein n=1 Tax=Kwoniella pini CBS 10737 TaxID=1296096 RepID=A0A1B9IC32_9TREE|nr:uncharacterized protein I206_00377 [Kwoniella pini CBS 10737]OCF53076.1 hypothetical protein I206_00377 [Kwoniella pini CBS 10737]